MNNDYEIEVKEGPNFLQKSLHRRLDGEDSYIIWRRLDQNVNSYLIVIWHKNWDEKRLGSDYTSTHEPAEAWAQKTLLRIHYGQDTLNRLHEDFKLLADDPDFSASDSDSTPTTFKQEMQTMYDDLAIDDEGEPVYLADGVWLFPDGTIGER